MTGALSDAAIDPIHPTGQRVRLEQIGGTNKFVNLWSNIGAAQGWLVIRKRNRGNDLEVHLRASKADALSS